MLFSTATQYAVLALVLIAGWLFGLASHSGGRKWKDRYLAERDAHAAARRDGDARAADAQARAAEADRRYAELERDHAKQRSATPVMHDTVPPAASDTGTRIIRPDGSEPTPLSSARPAYPNDRRI